MTRPQIPSARHQAALPPLERKGFAKALHKHTGLMLGRERVIPDAFHFDLPRQVLTLYEVEVTHFIAEDEDKLWKLRLMRDVLRDLGWRLRVRLLYPSDAQWRPMDWGTGRARLSQGDLRRAVRSLDRARRP